MKNILTLMLTDQCNCDCSYCYQKTLKNKKLGYLNTEKIEMFDDILPKVDAIQFFGGEPLVEEKFIFKLDERIDQLIKDNKLHAKPEYVFSSNLVFLSKRFKEFLFKLKQENTIFTFTITIDGMQAIHDKHRILKNGEGTYDQILTNYKFLIRNSMDCVETIVIVYNNSHYTNGISLKDCVVDVSRHFPTVKYVNFNCEGLFDETKVPEDIFYQLKFDLLQSVFEDIITKKELYLECKPFLLEELTDICGSIMAQDADINKCIMGGKKISVIPNGDVFMCVDQYYAHKKPTLNLSDAGLSEVFKDCSITDNIKPIKCYNCQYKLLCRLCPLQMSIEETCNKNIKYYAMILSYLEKIYSNEDLIKYFINYSGISNNMILLIYKYLVQTK